MSPEFPAPHVVEPRQGHLHTHTIIFLHGRDSNAQEFSDELFESEGSLALTAALETARQPSDISDTDTDLDRTLPALLPTVRWVFPQAPMLRSARFGSDMPQWFDMWTTENPRATEHVALQGPGLRRAMAQILHTLTTEERLVPTSRIFMCGISQGFAAIIAALTRLDGDVWRRMVGLAGLVGLSSWMPPQEEDEDKRQGAHVRLADTDMAAWRALPVMLQHCIDDDIITIKNGQHLRNELAGMWGHQGVEWREYEDGGHWLNEPRGVDDLVGFLRRCIAQEKDRLAMVREI
ncbi:phospholipase/Carboxylesterase [Xylaria telfairii]|nr:phospholipase/Carboxylesterase [Xylaria telfairii]